MNARIKAARNMSWPRLRLKRVGFWRSLWELMAITMIFWVTVYVLAALTAVPLAEILSYVGMGLYLIAAWRLDAGSGSRLRRAARLIGWISLFSVLGGIVTWLINELLPLNRTFLGIEPQDLRIPIWVWTASILLLSFSVFFPARVLIDLWLAGRTRLRWQLTASYLLVGLLTTLLIPFGLGAYVAIVSLAIVPPLAEPGQAVERATAAIRPLMIAQRPPSEVQQALAGLLSGRARIPLATDQSFEQDLEAISFTGVRRITVLQPNGIVLAGAGSEVYQAGSPLPADVATQYTLLTEQIRAGGCINGRPANGLITDSAMCAITDDQGQVIGTLLVESTIDGATQTGVVFGRVVTYVLLSASLALNILPLIACAILPLAFGVGYWLARRLTMRLERLTTAAGALATGDLGRRVAIDAADEVGRLSADFNAMAARLYEREQALRAEKERSEQLLQANRRLTADVSHELRTPLTTLRGYIDALAIEHGDKLPEHDLHVIQNEVQRLTALIDDLFTLVRTEAHQLPLTVEAIDAGAIARNLAATLAPLAQRERQIEVIADLPPRLPQVCADRGRLEQVLLNLLQNALRHTPAGGIVAITAAADNDQVRLSVADTGVGIPPEEQPLVFQRFFRGDSSRARETGGAGLGLALVHELVTAMGGAVTLESKPGRGSRFTIVLQQARPTTQPS